MKIIEINMLHSGSTGKIMLGLAETARRAGHQVYTFSPHYYQRGGRPSFPPIEGHEYFGTPFENMLHLRASQITGLQGYFSWFGTKELLSKVSAIHPDVIHLHNLHNRTINLPMLFAFIKRSRIPTVWTLHDCWSFTGQCPHFTMEKCDKWRSGCGGCSQIRSYPDAFVDRTRFMWRKKQSWFTGVPQMTLVTPSQWLAGLVKQSFLREYPVEVIPNGIDLSVFKPRISSFRERYHISASKNILLGVAFGWGERKGLDVFLELAKRLDGAKYQIVLVGTDDSVDKQLPESILSIHRTENQQQLVEIYTAADLFVNPTREENYPTVNMESIACGTPVLTFRTGGSPEIVSPDTGSVVDCDDVDSLEKEIVRICQTKPYTEEQCLNRAAEFDQFRRFKEYIRLYERES